MYVYYKCLAFCGTLVILRILRMSRNVTRIVFNAQINVGATASFARGRSEYAGLFDRQNDEPTPT